MRFFFVAGHKNTSIGVNALYPFYASVHYIRGGGYSFSWTLFALNASISANVSECFRALGLSSKLDSTGGTSVPKIVAGFVEKLLDSCLYSLVPMIDETPKLFPAFRTFIPAAVSMLLLGQ
jgi:hypothetical protein